MKLLLEWFISVAANVPRHVAMEAIFAGRPIKIKTELSCNFLCDAHGICVPCVSAHYDIIDIPGTTPASIDEIKANLSYHLPCPFDIFERLLSQLRTIGCIPSNRVTGIDSYGMIAVHKVYWI